MLDSILKKKKIRILCFIVAKDSFFLRLSQASILAVSLKQKVYHGDWELWGSICSDPLL